MFGSLFGVSVGARTRPHKKEPENAKQFAAVRVESELLLPPFRHRVVRAEVLVLTAGPGLCDRDKKAAGPERKPRPSSEGAGLVFYINLAYKPAPCEAEGKKIG